MRCIPTVKASSLDASCKVFLSLRCETLDKTKVLRTDILAVYDRCFLFYKMTLLMALREQVNILPVDKRTLFLSALQEEKKKTNLARKEVHLALFTSTLITSTKAAPRK